MLQQVADRAPEGAGRGGRDRQRGLSALQLIGHQRLHQPGPVPDVMDEGGQAHASRPCQLSTSPVEGQISRLRMVKRSMYGRAGFAPLRQRVLNAA
jgi:hypothetical protein